MGENRVQLTDSVVRWLKENVDFAFFLAAFTETPRWTVAFMAVHEPMLVGVPLGVLLSFATARAWRKFFETRNWWLFSFNALSMLIAVAVIAPVLYAMTTVPADQVDLSKVLSPVWLGVWASLLALTTFIPLVQLAAVQDIPLLRTKEVKVQKPVQPKTESVQPDVQEDVQTEQVEEKPAQVDDKVRAKQMSLEGLSNVEIGRALGKSHTTIGRWLNGVKAHG